MRSFGQPLPLGFVKLNWDASLNEKEGRIGLGLIARDCCGDVLGARCISKILRVDPKLDEAIWLCMWCNFVWNWVFLR